MVCKAKFSLFIASLLLMGSRHCPSVLETVLLILFIFRSLCLQKGFPLDVTLDQVKEFFKAFGETDNIHMRKDFKKQFKVHIESAVESLKSSPSKCVPSPSHISDSLLRN